MIDLDKAILEHHSTRMFLPNQPVPRQLVDEALNRAASAVELQHPAVACRVRVRTAPRPPRRRRARRAQPRAAEYPTAAGDVPALPPRTGRRTSRQPSRAAPELPHPRLGWYAGLAVMAIFEVIEWPLAIVMMLGHEIAHRARGEALRDFAEGVEAGA